MLLYACFYNKKLFEIQVFFVFSSECFFISFSLKLDVSLLFGFLDEFNTHESGKISKKLAMFHVYYPSAESQTYFVEVSSCVCVNLLCLRLTLNFIQTFNWNILTAAENPLNSNSTPTLTFLFSSS